jgi:hypothetical protein
MLTFLAGTISSIIIYLVTPIAASSAISFEVLDPIHPDQVPEVSLLTGSI